MWSSLKGVTVLVPNGNETKCLMGNEAAQPEATLAWNGGGGALLPNNPPQLTARQVSGSI